ncbi:unnamed protein product, partial [Ectocarpus fasciculatus]
MYIVFGMHIVFGMYIVFGMGIHPHPPPTYIICRCVFVPSKAGCVLAGKKKKGLNRVIFSRLAAFFLLLFGSPGSCECRMCRPSVFYSSFYHYRDSFNCFFRNHSLTLFS